MGCARTLTDSCVAVDDEEEEKKEEGEKKCQALQSLRTLEQQLTGSMDGQMGGWNSSKERTGEQNRSERCCGSDARSLPFPDAADPALVLSSSSTLIHSSQEQPVTH